MKDESEEKKALYYLKQSPWPEAASRALLNGIEDLEIIESDAGTVNASQHITTHCIPNLKVLYDNGVPHCPGCGASCSPKDIKAYKTRELLDTPLHSHPHRLLCHSGLYNCRNIHCAKKTFAVNLKCALPGATVTNNLADYILDCSLDGEPLSTIAKKCGISHRTAYKIRDTEIARRESFVRYQATEHMGIDETFVGLKETSPSKGNNLFVTVMATRPGELAVKSDEDLHTLCTDSAKAKEKEYNTGVVAFKRMRRDEESVIKLFEEIEDFDKVQTLTTDMCMPFISAAEFVNPNITIIIDRFHVVKSLIDKTKATATKLYKTTKAELDTQIKTLEEDAGADPDVLKKLRNQKKVWKLIIGMTVLVRMRKTFLQPINPILTRCQRFRLNYMNCIPSKKCCDMTFTKQKLLQTQNGLQANAELGFQKYLLPQKEVKTTHTMRCGHISKRLMKALSPNTSITTSCFRAENVIVTLHWRILIDILKLTLTRPMAYLKGS